MREVDRGNSRSRERSLEQHRAISPASRTSEPRQVLSPTGLPDHRSPVLSPSATLNGREVPPRSIEPRQASSSMNDRSRLESQKHSEPQILSNQPSNHELTSKYAHNHQATFLSAKSREIIQSVRDSFQDLHEEQPDQIFQDRHQLTDDVDRYLQRG